jgi:hypothetical protein
MADWIPICFEVGGTIPSSIIDELICCLNDDIDTTTGNGNVTRKDFDDVDPTLTVCGTAKYGLCKKSHDFCIKHQIPFIITAEAYGEYDADTTFFIPGMEDSENYQTDKNEQAIVRAKEVRPMFDLLLALIDQDLKALPKFLNNPAVADLVKDCLDSPAEIIKHLKEKLSEILPNEAPDSLPPLIIDETK